MGAGNSVLEKAQNGSDVRTDVDLICLIQSALKCDELSACLVTFLRNASPAVEEKNCIRMYMDLNLLQKLCKRASKYLTKLSEYSLEQSRAPKTQSDPGSEIKWNAILVSLKEEIRVFSDRIINLYVVTDARRHVQLPHPILQRFRNLGAETPSHSISTSIDLASPITSFAAGYLIGSMTIPDILTFIIDAQVAIVPVCRDIMNAFLAFEKHSILVQKAIMDHQVDEAAEKEEIEKLKKSVAKMEPSSGSSCTGSGSPPTSITNSSFSPRVSFRVNQRSHSHASSAGGVHSVLEHEVSPEEMRPANFSSPDSTSHNDSAYTPRRSPSYAAGMSDPDPGTENGSEIDNISMLVVDDSFPMLKMLTFTLSRAGVHVTGAQDGAQALDLLKKYSYHAVLIDLQMPKMDGYQLAYQCRKHELLMKTKSPHMASKSSIGSGSASNHSGEEELIPYVASITADSGESTAVAITDQMRVPLIAMSSEFNSETERKVAECGMDYFVSKPFTAAAIMAVLKELNPRIKVPVQL